MNLSKITDADFLDLKIRYYSEGHDSGLPRTANATGRPGGTNNQTQNALRWGYNQAVKDIGDRIIKSILGTSE